MSQDDFVARCRAQILQQGKEAAASHYQAVVREIAELEGLGIGLTFAEVYSVGPYRYRDLSLAVKQARRMQSSGSEA